MARKGQPINVDVPAADPVEAPKRPAEASEQRDKAPRRAAEAPEQRPKASRRGAANPKRRAEASKDPEQSWEQIPGAEAKRPSGGSGPIPPPPPRRRRRKPVPAALKAIAGLVVVAVVFIVAAILGGGSPDSGSIPSAPPTAEQTVTTPVEPPPQTEEPSELGFPQLATNNTTRVAGDDPASIAGAVALAVYPSAGAGQRPSSVALVNADDWQTAIAGAVLMAQPLAAPLLVAEDEELPEASSSALEALDPTGAGVPRRTQAFAVGGAAAPDGLRTVRLKATGAAGAAAIARLRDRLLGSPPRHLLIAPASRPELAAPAAAWAARSGDPVLFTERNRLPGPTAAALRRHPDVPVYVLGPSSAVSSQLVREIDRIGRRVKRVSGRDSVGNAIALARYDDGDFGWNVNDPGHGFVVARAGSPLDAVAAAPLSASGTWGPLLLTDSADTLPAAVRDYLLDVKPGYTTDPTRAFYNHVWVIGNQEAIDVEQQAELDKLAELAKIGGER